MRDKKMANFEHRQFDSRGSIGGYTRLYLWLANRRRLGVVVWGYLSECCLAVVIFSKQAIILGNPAIVLSNLAIALDKSVVVLGNPAIVLNNPAILLDNSFITLVNPAIILGNAAIFFSNQAIILSNPAIILSNPVEPFGIMLNTMRHAYIVGDYRWYMEEST